MRFVYTGKAEIPLDLAQECLELANMYLLEDLKATCGDVLGRGLSEENVSELHTLARTFHCSTLAEHCAAFLVLRVDEMLTFLRDKSLRRTPEARPNRPEQMGGEEDARSDAEARDVSSPARLPSDPARASDPALPPLTLPSVTALPHVTALPPLTLPCPL